MERARDVTRKASDARQANIAKAGSSYESLKGGISQCMRLLYPERLAEDAPAPKGPLEPAKMQQMLSIFRDIKNQSYEAVCTVNASTGDSKSGNYTRYLTMGYWTSGRVDNALKIIEESNSHVQTILDLLKKGDISTINSLLNKYPKTKISDFFSSKGIELIATVTHDTSSTTPRVIEAPSTSEVVIVETRVTETAQDVQITDRGPTVHASRDDGIDMYDEKASYFAYMQDRRNVEYKENMDNRHIDERSDLEMMMEAKRRRIDDILRHMPPEDLSRVYEFCVGKRKEEEEEVPTPELDALPTGLRDIPRLLFPTSFEMKLEQQTKLNREQLVKHVATCFAHEGGALLYDMDYTLLDPRKSLKFRKKWISAMRIFQEINASNNDEKSQIRFGICSGRSLEEIQASFKISGPEALAVEPHMHEYGERGDVYRGPRSDGEKVLIRKELKQYTHFVEKIHKDIISEIRKNNILRAYMAKGSIPQDISIKNNALGLSILDQGTTFFIENVQIATGKPMSANDLKEASGVLMKEMRKILSGVIKKYPDFEVEERLGFFIRLKESAAGQKLGKGAALQDLVDAYNLSSAFIIGDGEVDVEAAEKGYQLRRVNEFIDDYISNLPEKKMEFLKRFTESIEKYRSEEKNAAEAKPEVELEINAEDNVVKERIRRKNKLHERLLRLNKRILSKTGLIGVKRPKDIPESPNVAKKSMHVATGIDDVASLSYDIAIRTREIRKDIERQRKVTQERITRESEREARIQRERELTQEGVERDEMLRRMSGGEEGTIRVRATTQELPGILGMIADPAISANIQGMEIRNPVTGALIGGLTRRTTGRNPVNRENEDPNSAVQPRIVELPDPNRDTQQP